MLQYSDISGGVATAPDSTHTFGPYVQAIPVNPISNVNTLRMVNGSGTAFSAPSADAGWWFNSTTGEFRADLTDTWVTGDGAKYNTL